MRTLRLATWVFAGVLSACASQPRHVTENPFVRPGAAVADGRMGQFAQNNTGDCFFLAALLALAQDRDGRHLLQSALSPSSAASGWHIVFPNLPGLKIDIAPHESRTYRLLSSDGRHLSSPAIGDPDVALLEIAADKAWKRLIKPQGLWDDVPMNAFYLFSAARQWLIWNRKQAGADAISDIAKYRHLAGDSVFEIAVTSTDAALSILQALLESDKDGISAVLIDYSSYHAAAIVAIDFDGKRYLTLDTYANDLHEHALNELLTGLAEGRYALDYLEIEP